MMVAVFMNDEKEPLSVCKIMRLYKSTFYGGEWARVRWYIYRGTTPYPQGIFRVGVDHTALDIIPLTRFRDMDRSPLSTGAILKENILSSLAMES